MRVAGTLLAVAVVVGLVGAVLWYPMQIAGEVVALLAAPFFLVLLGLGPGRRAVNFVDDHSGPAYWGMTPKVLGAGALLLLVAAVVNEEIAFAMGFSSASQARVVAGLLGVGCFVFVAVCFIRGLVEALAEERAGREQSEARRWELESEVRRLQRKEAGGAAVIRGPVWHADAASAGPPSRTQG